MKKYTIFFLFFILTFASCTTETINTRYDTGKYSIVVIEGCEYFESEYSWKGNPRYNYTLTHKGNCRNPIHKCPCQGQ